ncbi:hypothetical protein KDW_12290 [Dictyobacter vulcani]|uniref:3-keto-disaccharide hydrolase domain-containing protein n=2 Tax=Dictyobacter vulcani TaxID=2607529 RepID=A0A5J4KKZ7_9CHLR|nr:hypothetical protein KDW_12290 [Dictyobacter vulcani]
MTNPDWTPQQPDAGNGPQSFLPPQQSWGGSADAQSSQPAQRSWNETAAEAFQSAQQPGNGAANQNFQSPPSQSASNFNTMGNSNTQLGSNGQPQRTPTGQLGRGSSLLGNPMFPKTNNGQAAPATRQLDDTYGAQPNGTNNSGIYNKKPTGALGTSGIFQNPGSTQGNSGTFKNQTGAPGNNGMHQNPTEAFSTSGMYTNQTGASGNTGALMHPAGEYSGDTGMLKLNQAVKVVRIPVAGKPGEFKTGILPVISQTPTGTLPPLPPPDASFQGKVKKNGKLVLLAVLALLIVFGSGIYMMTRSSGNMPVATTGSGNKPGQTISNTNLNATATVQAQPTPTFLIDDNLSSNGRGWLTTETRPDLLSKGIKAYFADNAYHVSSKKTKDVPYFVSSAQRGIVTPAKYTLSVDMQQIKGDEGNAFNFFGLLFNYTEIGGHPITYAFRLVNNKDDRRYEFTTLDDRIAGGGWAPDPKWKHATGKEFKGGKAKNNLKVQVVGHQFTFFVNGVKLGSATDSSYGPGNVGVGVNGLADKDGSDVAFTNFVMTTTN